MAGPRGLGYQEWFTDAGRLVLGDISRSSFIGRVHSAGNIVSSSLDLYSPAASPDEEVIYTRGRQSQVDLVSSSFSEIESDDESTDFLWTSTKRGTHPLKQHRKQLRTSRLGLDELEQRRKFEMKPRASVQPASLQTKLQAFSKDQLSKTIDRLVAVHPQLEAEVRETLSVPDLVPMKERLEYLRRAVYRAFPTFRWGSSRNSYCYRRVRVPIDIFKRTCIDQAKTLVSSQCWEAVINYVEMAWAYVYLLPKFDDPANNRPRLSCFRFLTAQCMAAINNGKFSADKLKDVRIKLKQLCLQHNDIEPCIRKVEKMLRDQDSETSSNVESSVDLSVSELESSTPNAKRLTLERLFSEKESFFSQSIFSQSLLEFSTSDTEALTSAYESGSSIAAIDSDEDGTNSTTDR